MLVRLQAGRKYRPFLTKNASEPKKEEGMAKTIVVETELEAIFAEQGRDYVLTAETHAEALRAVANQILAELENDDSSPAVDCEK